MSNSTKKHNESSQAGFLRPTVASQRRCVKQCSLPLPVPKGKKKLSKKKSKTSRTKDSSVSTSPSAYPKHGTKSLLSAIEVYGCESKHNLSENDHPGLLEARKMCEQLKEQIDDLKLHQEAYEERLKHNIPLKTSSKSNGFGDCGSDPKVHVHSASSEALQLQHLTDTTYFDVQSKPVTKVNFSRKEKPFQDASNLPEQMSYNSLFCKPNTPESLIKKLNSERDRYKRKVMKLQHELKVMKKQKNCVLKSPELSLHELSFFNADMVGEGRLAVVYEGTLSGRPVAVKKLIRSGVMTSSDRSYLAAEAGLLLPLEHKNIVQLLGVCSSPMEPLIVTEFVNGKTLSDMLAKSGGSLDPSVFYSVARDVAIGLAYLHSQKPPVLHLNLRPSNVLVDSFLRAKVSDYGFSKIRIDAGVSNCSNLAYLAPELLKFPAQITIKTDVYAFAVLMWQMTTGKDPMGNRTASQILDMMGQDERLRVRADLPFSIQQLIITCWDPSPIQRPTFKDLIIEFETMTLPDEWISKLKEIGINRTDTSDMRSVSRGSSTHASSMTTSSHGERKSRDNLDVAGGTSRLSSTRRVLDPPRSVCNDVPHATTLFHHTDLYKNEASPRLNFCRKDTDCLEKKTQQVSPTPLKDVRYIPHDLQSEINTPEIVAHASHLLSDDFWSKDYKRFNRDRPTVPANPSRYATCSEPYRTGNFLEPSKFESKFRDYVSDACQAESTHKAHSSAYRSWPNLPPSSLNQRAKSLLSSENIQVRSVDTHSSSGKSLETAVYVPEPIHSNGILPIPLTEASDTVKITSLPDEFRRPESNLKGSLILTKAKRLLSTSPLQTSTSHKCHLSSSAHAEVSFPEYKPRYQSHRHPSAENGYVCSESSKSDFSIESFLPLPRTLYNQHHLLSNDYSNRVKKDVAPKNRNPAYTNPKPIAVEIQNGVGELVNEKQGLDLRPEADKVSRILTQTAAELSNASSMLYSATEELKKQKMNSTL